MCILIDYIILYGDNFSRISLYTYISFNGPGTLALDCEKTHFFLNTLYLWTCHMPVFWNLHSEADLAAVEWSWTASSDSKRFCKSKMYSATRGPMKRHITCLYFEICILRLILRLGRPLTWDRAASGISKRFWRSEMKPATQKTHKF